MKKALAMTQNEFESSCSRTPEYLVWHRLFKREFTKFLTEHGIPTVQISKPNHFDMSGFFQTSTGQIWYFSISDLRGFKNNMLIRTATSFRDFTGGRNQYISLCFGEETFAREFNSVIQHSQLPPSGDLVTNINTTTITMLKIDRNPDADKIWPKQ